MVSGRDAPLPQKTGLELIAGLMGALIPMISVPLIGFFVFLMFTWSPYFSTFAAFIYGALASFVVGVVICVIQGRINKYVSNYFLSEEYGTLKGSERRAMARKAVREVREDSIRKHAWQTRFNLYRRGVIIVVALFVVAYFANSLFGIYPKDLFKISPYLLIALWVILVLLLPDIFLVLLIVTLTGISLSLHILGPTILMYFIPFLFLMPMNFLMMFLVMFGPLMIINIAQIQTLKPTDARWGNTPDDVRGQKSAMRQLLLQIRIIASAEGDEMVKKVGERGRPRGILLFGPPGVGKTHSMRAMATILNAPIMIIPASAFSSAFMGVGIWTMFVVKILAGILQKKYKCVILFFDEAEQILMRRQGVMGGEYEAKNIEARPTILNILERDSYGRVANCGLGFIGANEDEISPSSFSAPRTHRFMFPGGMGGMGGGGAMVQPVLLNWMDGMRTPPLLSRIWRGKVNDLATAFWIPPMTKFGGKTIHFRVPPADPPPDNAVFVAATNMPHMIDPAFQRYGRFGLKIHFSKPSEEDREDLIDLFFSRLKEKGILDPDLDQLDRKKEFARATVGLSHVEIEQVTMDAYMLRNVHIQRVRELKRRLDSKDELDQYEKRFWERFKGEMEQSGWDRMIVNWESLSEALINIRSREANPAITSPRHRKTTAYHEFMGHMLPLGYFCQDVMRPVALSVMPRGGALGMVIHVPIEERDPEPQRVFDGLLRVMVGSVIAERVFFGDNQPGVSGDLDQATSLSASMVGRLAMGPRNCSEDEEEIYANMGKGFFTLKGAAMFSAESGGSGASSLQDPDKRHKMLVLLGQAVVDVWRLIDKNRTLADDDTLIRGGVCNKLLEVDEITGSELEELWSNLGKSVKPLTNEDKIKWPPKEIFASENPFYENNNGEDIWSTPEYMYGMDDC